VKYAQDRSLTPGTGVRFPLGSPETLFFSRYFNYLKNKKQPDFVGGTHSKPQ